MAGPLEGIKILDLTWAMSGPFGIMTLCDLGAEVIKIERPNTGDLSRRIPPVIDGVSLYYFSLNRGKKSVVIDLQTEKGKELFLDLIEKVDVVAENFVPGTMDRLGIGYQVLKKRNPRLIFASCSGFGQTGPYRERPALDIITQAMGGMMSITGEEGGPPVRPGASMGDIGGGVFLAIGILSALVERQKSDQGQMLDISMLDCQVAFLENAFVRYLKTGELPERIGTRHPLLTPFQVFPTKDGHIAICVSGTIEQWALFTETIEMPDLLSDERFHEAGIRTKYHKILEPIITEALKKKTSKEWLTAFEAIGIPCGPLNSVPDVAVDPQILHREMFVELNDAKIGKIKVCNTPVRLSRTPAKLKKPAPALGENTDEVLSGVLGLDEKTIESLKESGVINNP
jgi:CoA:oxalate CoA-transferase